MKNAKKIFLLCIFIFSFVSAQSIAENIKYVDHHEIKRREHFKPQPSQKKATVLSTNFIENKGQIEKEILYYAYIKEGVLQIKKEGIYLVPKDYSNKTDGKNTFKNITLLEFIDENDNCSVKGHKPSATKYNFYPDMNPAHKNRYEDIESFDYVIFHNVYYNIDLKVYKNKDLIEYDWILNPGSKIDDIKFRIDDSADKHIDYKGDVCSKSKREKIIHKKPDSFQFVNNVRKPLNSNFIKLSDDVFSFQVEKYNPEYPLFIDPLVLVSASYLGGTDYEWPDSQSIDNQGNLYMVGMTQSFDFPLVNSIEEPEQNPNGYYSLWIAKFDKDFRSPIYISLFGQQWSLNSKDSAVDANGCLYVLTQILHYDPICDSYGRCIDGYNSFENVHGNNSILIFSVDKDGHLLFTSVAGGTGNEYPTSIKIDKRNSIYITGITYSQDFPTENAYQPSLGGLGDIFLIKYTPFCENIIYSTLYGEGDYDLGDELALDEFGSTYIAAEWVSYDKRRAYNRVVKFNSKGGLDYDFWFAPNDYGKREEIYYIDDITVDRYSRANIVGLLPGKNVTADYDDWDAFFYVLNPQGTDFEYSTVFGGNFTDEAKEIKIDRFGDIYISGYTASKDFPLKYSLKNELEGLYDTFIMKIDHSTKNIIFSSLLGGNSAIVGSYGVDYFSYLDLGKDGTIYLSGFTSSDNLPVKNAYQYWMPPTKDPYSGDVYFLRLKWNGDIAALINSNHIAGLAPALFQFDSNTSESVSGEIMDWNWDFGDNSRGNGQGIIHEYSQPGEYLVTLKVTDNLGRSASDMTSIFIFDHTDISVDVNMVTNQVKANGKENLFGSIMIKDIRNNSIVHLTMQPAIIVDDGNHIIEYNNIDFIRSDGTYMLNIPSGTPGKAKLAVAIDNYLQKEIDIEFLWPQPPLNFSGKANINRSLTRKSECIDLNWKVNPDQHYQIAKYRVFRTTGSNSWELLTELSNDVIRYIDCSAISFTNLHYAISSIDIEGDESEKALVDIHN